MFFNKIVRIVIKNQNLAIEAKTGANLYDVLVAEKVIPPTLCRGSGQCGRCKVHIHQKNVSKPNKKEQIVLAKMNLDAGFRLACQTIVKDKMWVDTTEIMAPVIPDDMVIKPVNKGDLPLSADESDLSPTEEDASSGSVLPPAAQTPAPVLPHTLKNPQKPATAEKPHEIGRDVITDGILLVHSKQQLRYFVYSAAIDGIVQDVSVDNAEPLIPYIDNGILSDYIYDILKIKDIDRVIILSDEPGAGEESLFDIVSYTPFDIGATPCELIRPLPETGDMSLFLRLLSMKGKKRLMIPLDKLDHIYYLSEDSIVKIPNHIPLQCNNLFDLAPVRSNSVVDISDDLRTITAAKQFFPPDCLPLPLLMKVAAEMVKRKIADSEFKIYHRSELGSSVPLEYVVKITQHNDGNAFYLHRDKESSLMITQDMLSALALARKFIHYAVEYTESNLGNLETIVISTPAQLDGLMDNITAISLVPKRREEITVYSPGDSPVNAVKLFQGHNVRSCIQHYYGGFITSV